MSATQSDSTPKHAADVTIEWLRSIRYQIQPASRVPTIEGVIVKDLRVNLDGRGDVIELWSRPWIEAENLVMPAHVYQSATDHGVVKCWHLHDIHTDQFTVTRGKLQVSLVDIRPDSPTFGHVNAIFLGSQRPRLIKIPPMIMHGWKALTPPEVIVVNLQSHVYDAADEFKFPWNCVLEEVWEPRNG
ncbi:MAG TPA: dTDP-4-dehydrorhamnose 3,5-epimerase family protein [Kouleothrix sp.]|uniref:dTDP-4-dehydrorhamnose 3,5-epimerase family protein n=1 Tax=Kouleothrix sp. TaxID=2779161 RepID=UPI002C824AD4|nr:dTDP-4-dehydrorhamnose 3,5-epimerase family protein [Kouleothrix sp.]HRC76672.1 dTDP-4-dehydrorhamnose 3,5-epimerase family protein [Kouleothrix sp.]